MRANSDAGRRKTYLAAHSTAPEKAKAIADGQVVLGMTSDEAKASWGQPVDVNVSRGSWGVHEQWVYNCYDFFAGAGYPCRYLYVENGKVTSWQR